MVKEDDSGSISSEDSYDVFSDWHDGENLHGKAIEVFGMDEV